MLVDEHQCEELTRRTEPLTCHDEEHDALEHLLRDRIEWGGGIVLVVVSVVEIMTM